jgi:rRNA-processing protein EBP2
MAAQLALPKLEKSKIPTKRPEDYFAEMSKSDEHMKRVRETLLNKHAEIEKRDKLRKMRELKKMGKSIQMEVEKKKLETKKNMNESIKKFKKTGNKDDLDIALEMNDGKEKKSKKDGQIKKKNDSKNGKPK